MKKKRIILFGMMMLITMLFGCNDGKNDKVNGDTKEVAESSNGQVTKNKQEEEVEETALSTPTANEFKVIMDNLIENISTVYLDAINEYDIADGILTESIYESMAMELEPFATKKMIETQLYEIAKEFCYLGCDAYFFPRPSSEVLRFQIENTFNNKVILEYIVPENELSGGYTETVTIVYDNGDWKMDSFHHTVKSFQLSTEEAEQVLEINGYENVTFIKETVITNKEEAVDYKVYVFQLNNGEKQKIGVYANTGYSFLYYTEEISSESGKTQKDDYLQKLEALEDELAWIDDQYETKAVAEMRALEEQRYQKWDDILNEIYGVLQKQLPKDEMNDLRQKQHEWIPYRDEQAEIGTDALGGGWSSLQYTINLIDLTKERCYEFVELYM